MTVTIIPVEGDLDLFCKYQGQHDWQPAYIEIDGDKLSAGYNAEIGGAVSFDVWHRRILRYRITAMRASEANQLLERIAPLAERIAAGHSIEWDGNNNVGRLDEDASEAEEELEYLLDQYVPEDGPWMAEDWLQDADYGEITADTTNEELSKISEEWMSVAKSDGVAIYDGVGAIERVLERRRNRLLDEREAEAA